MSQKTGGLFLRINKGGGGNRKQTKPIMLLIYYGEVINNLHISVVVNSMYFLFMLHHGQLAVTVLHHQQNVFHPGTQGKGTALMAGTLCYSVVEGKDPNISEELSKALKVSTHN